MSNSLETNRTRVPSRQVAWGLLTTNLGLPGLGSLLAGRKIGVPQLLLSLTALGLTMVFGLKFVLVAVAFTAIAAGCAWFALPYFVPAFVPKYLGGLRAAVCAGRPQAPERRHL